MAIEISKEKFKSTVGLGMQHANVQIREVVTALSEYNKERRQETPEAKKELNPQVWNKISSKDY